MPEGGKLIIGAAPFTGQRVRPFAFNTTPKMDTQDSDLIVVGIGTSAGGLESLKEFFSAMPVDSDLAFVVIQHLDPNHVSYMADLLAKCTEMTVV